MAMGPVEGRSRAFLSVMAMIAIIGVVAAQSPPASSGCITSITNLWPCLSYITTNFITSPPSPGCCGAFSSFVKTSAVCLCQLFPLGIPTNPLGVPINQTRALELPGACNVTIAPLSQCKAVGAPAPSPSAVAGGSNNGVLPSTDSISPPVPSNSTSTTRAFSPSARPSISSVRGISPPGEGRKNPTSNTVEAHFGMSRVLILVAGVIVVFIV